ncbi:MULTISPECIES: helix-turn-helix domain-containing protein [Parafrankia]|uniref:helix-turn-helix domain-containing protein n=1 Tax=Parafrankia TaxID=2994362 RepID=UPI000B843281|nr:MULTISPECIES: helix-turn-helix domain-containing protein [Parafrankia]MBE3201541.1 helix-turn-helix domain-containing protein [Parafrankia sp. CH37]
MRELAVRLADLDVEAAVAIRVIAHFDLLVASRAGLPAIVASAAELAACPVRLADPTGRHAVRMLPDGTPQSPSSAPDPTWPTAAVNAVGAALWLEAPRPVPTLQAVVLERAAAAVRAALERTAGQAHLDESASLELVLDARVSKSDRLAAVRRLRLPARVRAIALEDGTALVLAHDARRTQKQRAGIGPAVAPADLPASWDAARLALRLTADGTDADPGPRVVHADELGVLALLIPAVDSCPRTVPDIQALHRTAATAPWMLATLDAVASTGSLRDAARTLNVHHSTLQGRLAHAEVVLGWPLKEPAGRLRLQLALASRRILRSATT